LAELRNKLQWSPEHHRKCEQRMAEIPELFVEQARPQSIGMEKTIIDCSVEVIRTERCEGCEPEVQQKVSTNFHWVLIVRCSGGLLLKVLLPLHWCPWIQFVDKDTGFDSGVVGNNGFCLRLPRYLEDNRSACIVGEWSGE